MKPIQDIERTRRAYHRDGGRDTVHRSSLLVPRLAGARAELTFANHFLLKRGYRDVACRLTAIDRDGQRIGSRTCPVREPRVHVFELDETFGADAVTWMVEFFCADNLYIPFPAAMVNHRGRGFLNSVHSYNRVLNDVFEDDEVNAEHVREASIDVRVDDRTDTFVLFTAGPTRCRGEVEIVARTPARTLRATVPVDLPRLTNREISLRELFAAELPLGTVLTVQQPRQDLFYGRLLAGLRSNGDGAAAANHSFYDCSERDERWDDGAASFRVYPLFLGFEARVRLYPIFSPCELAGAVDYLDGEGRVLATVPCGPLRAPSDETMDVPVSALAAAAGATAATGFRLRLWATDGRTPRRLNHQVVYGDPRSPLAASVAISLRNPNALAPDATRGLSWGQCALGADLDTRVGIVLDRADGVPVPVELRLLGEQGEVHRERFQLHGGATRVLDPRAVAPGLVPPSGARPHYLWYYATAPRADLASYMVTRDRRTGHCTGEHGF